MIVDHGVLVEGQRFQKPGKKFSADVEIALVVEDMPWVSRGALKLLAALEAWADIDVEGAKALDVGCSTGGFSHVLLEHGAAAVLGVDPAVNVAVFLREITGLGVDDRLWLVG